MRHRVVNTMLNKLDLPPCTLGEGPVWRKESQEFIFTDIVNGTLYAAAQDGTVRILLQCRYQLGAFLLDAAGDLLLLTEAGVCACPYGGGEENFRLIWQIPMLPGERFNDAICDPVGRVLAGTKTEQDRNGSLWQFAPGQPPRRLLGGLKISNGMGFSGQGRIFYHTDSPDRTISQYDYDVETGRLSHGRALVKTDGGCVPDGMTVDKDGFLWTACWGGGRVERYTPEGILAQRYPLPACQVSSLIFGGAELDTLLVTSAAIGASGGQDGGVWMLKPGVRGVEEYRAALAC